MRGWDSDPENGRPPLEIVHYCKAYLGRASVEGLELASASTPQGLNNVKSVSCFGHKCSSSGFSRDAVSKHLGEPRIVSDLHL